MEVRRGILFLFFLALGTFVFSADFSCASYGKIYPDGTRIRGATIWEKSESPYLIEGSLTFEIGSSLTIEPGVIVKFKYKKGALNIFGDFTVVGTEKDRIVFTSERDDSHGGDTNGDGVAARGDWLYINFGSTASSGEMRYVSLLYAGWNPNDMGTALIINNSDNVSVIRSEVMHTRGTGIKVVCARPTINENVISQNYTGIYSTCTNETPVFRNNSIYGNFYWGASVINPVTGVLDGHIDARDNWWGDASGPKHASNASGKGNQVSGNVLFDPWLGKNTNIGLDPVIIIPGIMGSWEVDGKWKIDPIFHTYDNLCEEFLANGYEDGKNFSVFPYEWRDSNVDNAKLLRDRINQIKIDTGRPKVDIVAHSMGGLLAREYIESDYFANDVDQLITVGTPHLGAPKDYVTWEAGEFLGLWSPVMKRLVALEALENGYLDVFDYIHKRPMKSVEELLPTYNYLYDENESDYVLRSGYPTNYPRNEFLENLNNIDHIKSLKNIEFTKIVGDTGSKTSTECEYHVVDADKSRFWKHGYPKYFDIPVLNRQGIIKCNGDGTVPLVSAEASDVPADKTMYFQSEHGDLPTDAQKDILEILTGKRPSGEVDEWHIPSVLVVLLHSPIDMQVISPSGEKIGKNFETDGTYNEIEGAYYTGFDTKTEFLTIPNPEDGEYKILTEGTGTGDYTIETTKISEDKDTGEAVETTATITGTAEPKVQEENKIKIDGDSVKRVEPLALSPKKKEPDVGGEEKINTEIPQAASGDVSAQLLESKTKIEQLDDLKNSVREYFKTKQIRKKSERSYLLGWLGNIRVYLKRSQVFEEKFMVSQKKYKNLQKKIVGHCNHLIRYLNKNSPKKIDEEAKNDLVERLNSLKM